MLLCLQLCGYGCEDHFYEADTEAHCWESLVALLTDRALDGLLFDVGMPVSHCGARYNARVWCYSGAILAIRPKLVLADDGNYREPRWFTAWNPALSRAPTHTAAPAFSAAAAATASVGPGAAAVVLPSPLPATLAQFGLPAAVTAATGQAWAPMGLIAVAAADVTLASEICEELFAPEPVHGRLYAAGVDIVSNASVRDIPLTRTIR